MRRSAIISIVSVGVLLTWRGVRSFLQWGYHFSSYTGTVTLHGGWTLTHQINTTPDHQIHHITGYQDERPIFTLQWTTTLDHILPLEVTSTDFFMSGWYHRLSTWFDIVMKGENTLTDLPDGLMIERHHRSSRWARTRYQTTIVYNDLTWSTPLTLSISLTQSCPRWAYITSAETIQCTIQGIITTSLPTKDQLQPLTIHWHSQYQSLL